MTVRLRQAIAVKIHCPVSAETLSALMAGDHGALDRDPAAARVLAVIRADNPLGDFGAYHGVCAITAGWESFRPGPDAKPTLGQTGEQSISPTAILTTYAAAQADLSAALGALMDSHPWEVPVIELSQVNLLVR